MESKLRSVFDNLFPLAGRALISFIFILAGYNKLMGYAGTVAYMQKAGVPGYLLPVVIAVELGGGLLLLTGFLTRIVALLLAGFTLLAAYFFHRNFGDAGQFVQFQKNLAIAGGLLFVVLYGAGRWSLDAKLS